MPQATATVPWRKRSEIERLATETREKYGVGSVPVDPYDLATRMGVDVFQATFAEETTAGAIRWRDGRPEILVREGDPSFRQAFTVAHELGHFLLHWKSSPSGEDGQATFIDSDLELYRHGPDLSETEPDEARARHHREVQANMFAAALLMPEAEVRKEWRRLASVKKLARAFEVSPMAMNYRIDQLGLW